MMKAAVFLAAAVAACAAVAEADSGGAARSVRLSDFCNHMGFIMVVR